MLTITAKVMVCISTISLILAEIVLWLFVGVGVCRVIANGVNGISSLMLSGSIALVIASGIFYFASFLCKMIINHTNKGVFDADNE